ncbi:hypothetical protein F4860DRAFT_510355 [Xylaria cubensis]|nr:hypothetical protein F4860DRAFT_510355 [Xylaria cubensis]
MFPRGRSSPRALPRLSWASPRSLISTAPGFGSYVVAVVVVDVPSALLCYDSESLLTKTSCDFATMMSLVNLEVPIVITALVTISKKLGGFENDGWIISRYLLGYVGQLL